MIFINNYFSELERIIKEIDRDKISQVVDVLFNVWKNQGTVCAIGCGGSASTATHFTCDLSKCTIVPGKNRFKARTLVDNIPLVSAWTNDSGWGSVFEEQLRPWLKKDDVLVGFSVHGSSGQGEAGPWSQNLVKAMKLAKEKRAKIIGFSGFEGGTMKKMADVCITIPINSEPLGTPLVESFHVVLHHLICLALKQKIEKYD